MSILTPSSAPEAEDRAEIEYPAEDGQPMAETAIHVQAIIVLFQGLLDALPESVFVVPDMFWYWEEGHPESRVAPDVMVVKGVGRANRRSFFTWREGGAIPSIVFEMASENTGREDLRETRRLYERLRVPEYVMFDPEGEYLRPRLLGFRLVGDHYELIEPDAEERLRSEELGLWMKAEGTMLRLINGKTGVPVPTRQERIEHECERGNALAAEVERLKALLEKASGGGGSGPAE
jgi:Uma2 family endonuclease